MARTALPEETEYGWRNYRSDRTLIKKVEALQAKHREDPTTDWEIEARFLLTRKRERVRTGTGNVTSGDEASFSGVLSDDVTGAQAYAVLVKEVEAARERAEAFKAAHADVRRDSPLEQIAGAIHIAEADGDLETVLSLRYLLGKRLVVMPPGKLRKAKHSIGYELALTAYAEVKPKLV